MNPTCPSQDLHAVNRISEAVLVALAYFAAKFSALAMTDHFPGQHPLLIATLSATLAAAIAAVGVGAWIDHSSDGRLIGRRRISGAQFFGCICGGIAASIIADFITRAVPYIGPVEPLLAQAFLDKGPVMLWAWMATVLVVGPIGEEMVFRGAIQGYLSKRIGTAAAIVVAALLFLLLHVPQLNGYWPAMVAILGLGITAGIARARTGSLLGAIVVHMAYNSVVMAFVLANRP